MAHCINRNDKEFIALVEATNIHPDMLDGAIQVWQDLNNSDEFPSQEYIMEHFKLGGKSTAQFSSLKDFEEIHEVWERSYLDNFKTDMMDVAYNYFEAAKKVFTPSGVGMVKRVDGSYEVSVLEPVFSKKEFKSTGSVFGSFETSAFDEDNVTEEVTGEQEKFYKSGEMTLVEIDYLANQAVNMFSTVLDLIQGIDENISSEDAVKQYFEGEFADVDFTRLDRELIIKKITPYKIFNMIKDKFFDPFGREDIQSDAVLDKLGYAYDNFFTLLDNAYPRLIKNELLSLLDTWNTEVNDLDSDTMSEEADVANNEEKGRESWLLGFRFMSANDSLSPLIKRAFDKLRERDSYGEVIIDEYGLPKLVDSDTVYNTIFKNLRSATNINQMELILTSMQNAHPWVQDVMKLIQKEPFRSLFFLNFRKDFTKYSVVSKTVDEQGNTQFRTTIVNTQGAEAAILDEIETMIKAGVFPLLIDVDYITGKGRLDIRKVTAIQDKVIKLNRKLKEKSTYTPQELKQFSEDNIKEISNIFQTLGMSMDDRLLNSIIGDSSRSNTDYLKTKAFQVLDAMSRIIKGMSEAENKVEYSPLQKDKGGVKGYYSKLIKLISPFLEEHIESSVFENGKLYYAFTTPSYLGKLMLKLKNSMNDMTEFREFMQENYNKYDWFTNNGKHYNEWLKLLSENTPLGASAREMLDHKVQLHFNNVGYSDLSAIDYSQSLIQEYFSDFSDNPNYAWYHVPVLADKPSSEFIKFKRYTDSNLPTSSGGYIETISKLLVNVAKLEMRRIKAVRERALDSNIEKIANFDMKLDKNGNPVKYSGGDKFHFLDFLNAEYQDSNNRMSQLIEKSITEELEMTEAQELSMLLQDAIKNGIEMRFLDALNEWSRMGLLDMEETKDGQEFTYLSTLGKTMDTVEENLRNYFWNSYLATTNIIQLTVTDIAYYKNMEDFQKRYAQIHSPALRLNIYAEDSNGVRYSDGTERTMYIKDEEVVSDIIGQVERIFDDKINSSTTTALKNGYKQLKKTITEGFKNINVADALGYSSLTGYRKKLGMAGRWTNQMEEAYNRVRNGDVNLSDLNVLWLPLKPFVYTQVEKNSYVGGLKTLKVPVLNKNSEFLLMIAGALAGKTNNKLREINKFMEDNNIDTVQFESSVKSGKLGVIDINSVNAEQVYDTLNNSAYIDGLYNEQYVHQLSFEEYGIQLEVPEHLMDTELLLGSQIKKLIMTDITLGTMFQVGKDNMSREELIKEYYDILALNIKDSSNQLLKEMNLDKADVKALNRALSRLLTKEIKSNARYGPELLRACSLDENGEFVVPLCDPIQSNRILLLLNSMIKNNVTKLKIKGGAVVQVAPYGLSDDLNIIFNEDGSVKHFECYIPAYALDIVEVLMEEDGQLNINKKGVNGKPILPEELRQLIGYRIPTEDKYSMVPLYIKGFLPLETGSSIMLPKEITLLSGSDYDIDKLYVMLPEFKKIRDIDYNAAWKDFKKDYNFVNKETSDAIANWFSNTFKNADIFGEEISEEEIKTQTNKDFRDFVRANIDTYNNGTSFAKDSYNANKGIERNTVEQRNNRLIDMIWSVLTNKDTADKIFNPGSFDTLKKSARIITLLKSGVNKSYSELAKMDLKTLDDLIENGNILKYRNIVDPTTLVYFHQLNTTAGKLIGVFANNNSSHALIQLMDIHFNATRPLVFDKIPFHTIKGTNSSLGSKIDNVVANDGVTLISKNIAGFLAASVDAVKDPVLNFMNLNTYTANAAMVLARLGYDSDSIGLLLTQPSIELVTREYFRKSNEGYITPDSVVNEMITKVNELLGGQVDVGKRDQFLGDTDFSKETLAKLFKVEKNADFYDYQLDVLLMFRELLKMGTNLNELTFITKFDTVSNAVGPTIADSMLKELRVNKFLEKGRGMKPPFSPEAYKILTELPLLRESFRANTSLSRKIFGANFPHFNIDFTQGLSRLGNMINSDLDSKTINKFVNEFIAFKLTEADAVFSGNPEDRLKYINGYAADEFFKLKSDPTLRDNKLILLITLQPKNRNTPMVTLQAKTGGLSAQGRELVKIAWTDLLKTHPDVALDLFKYNFYRSGFSFSPTSFMHLTPIEVKQALPDYIEYLRKGNSNGIFNEDIDSVGIFLSQFLRNNAYNERLVPRVNGISVSYTLDGDNFIFDTSLMAKNPEALKMLVDEDIYVPMMWVTLKDKNGNTIGILLLNISSDLNSSIYLKITPLGIKGNAYEYSFNEFDVSDSVIADNNKVKVLESEPFVREGMSEEALTVVYSQNQDIIDSIILKVNSYSKAQVDLVIGNTTNKRDKVIKMLREVYPGFREMDNKQRTSIINYFENKNIKDQLGNNIC